MQKSSMALWSQSILNASLGNPPAEMTDDVSLACMMQSSTPAVIFPPRSGGGPSSATIEVRLEGVVERALNLSATAKKVGILIFCSARRPGGGWLSGAFAQEEAVSMCSTWALGCENASFHDAVHCDTFYSDGVLSMQGALIASQPGTWLSEPVGVAFAGFAAPNMKAFRESGGDAGAPPNARRVFNALVIRCSNALAALSDSGCDAVVLGAIGCGVFEIDPAIAADAWRQALATHGAGFSHIDFALSPSPSPSILAAFETLASASPPPVAPKPRALLNR